MSGYRTLHREHVSSSSSETTTTEKQQQVPIWQVQATKTYEKSTSSISSGGGDGAKWRLWTASADGKVYSYQVVEKGTGDDNNTDLLNASAMKINCTHVLLGSTQTQATTTSSLGCTQISICKNYVGDDDKAGDYIITSINLVGQVRVWTIKQEDLLTTMGGESGSNNENKPTSVVATHEFHIENATGTTLSLLSPRISGNGDVIVAIGCLDGSVCLVATGLCTPQHKREPTPAGTIVDKFGTESSSGGISTSIPTKLLWFPTLQNNNTSGSKQLVIGRQDGIVDIYVSNNESSSSAKRLHRLMHHYKPVRGITFTPDGQLLITGSDEGIICIYDMNANNANRHHHHDNTLPLVHHIMNAHKSWILDIAALHSSNDNRRFVSIGADQQIHVWKLGEGYAPVHTFQCDTNVGIPWTSTIISNNNKNNNSTSSSSATAAETNRLIVGTDYGWLQISSL